MYSLITWLIKLIYLAFISLLLVPTAYADAPSPLLAPIAIETTVPAHIVPPSDVKVPLTYKQLAEEDAHVYGLNTALFVATIQCESQFDPRAVSKTGDYGIAQINLRSHPGVTIGEAFDPSWALAWMAEKWETGHADEWVCFRKLNGERL